MFGDPVKYNKVNLVNKKRTNQVLEQYHKYLKYGEKEIILDVGSGTGNVTVEELIPLIPHPNFRLIGVDIKKPFVDFANQSVKDPRVSFRVLDITEKDENQLKSVFQDEELKAGFDKVVSFSVIQWTNDHVQCFKNIYSLLKHGGQTLVWLGGHSTLTDVWRSVCNMDKWQPYLKNEPIFKFPFHDSKDTKADCTELLKSIGFQDIICSCTTHFMLSSPAPQDAPWRDIMECINPYLNKIPEHLRSEYMDDTMEMFFHNNKTNGVTLDIIVIIASKPLK